MKSMEWINDSCETNAIAGNDENDVAPMCAGALVVGGVIVACGASGYLCGSLCGVYFS